MKNSKNVDAKSKTQSNKKATEVNANPEVFKAKLEELVGLAHSNNNVLEIAKINDVLKEVNPSLSQIDLMY